MFDISAFSEDCDYGDHYECEDEECLCDCHEDEESFGFEDEDEDG